MTTFGTRFGERMARPTGALELMADLGAAMARGDQADIHMLGGGNPARIIALAAGLSDTTAALTIDRDCASGLDAILYGARLIAMGEASVVIAGGAESLSTAPWRVAKPRTVYQTPHFDSPNAAYDHTGAVGLHVRGGCARRRGRGGSIGRDAPPGAGARSCCLSESTWTSGVFPSWKGP